MVGALLLRNYEVKGPSDRLACAVAEDVLGGLVPIANDPLAVRRNDRMRARRERGLRDVLPVASLLLGMRPKRVVQPRVMGLEMPGEPRVKSLCEQLLVYPGAGFEVFHDVADLV